MVVMLMPTHEELAHCERSKKKVKQGQKVKMTFTVCAALCDFITRE